MSDVEQLEVGRLSWQARLDAWRLRRRAARDTRPSRAGVTALAAVGRLPGVQDAGKRVAVAVALLGVALGIVLALTLLPRANTPPA